MDFRGSGKQERLEELLLYLSEFVRQNRTVYATCWDGSQFVVVFPDFQLPAICSILFKYITFPHGYPSLWGVCQVFCDGGVENICMSWASMVNQVTLWARTRVKN